MRAAWYERQGPAAEVLTVGEMDAPELGEGEVLVRLRASGVNPSDVKMRAGGRGPMAFPRIVPHSDGAGVIEAVGSGVDAARVGERVWAWNAGWKRAMGTCAQYVALPAAQAVRLPETTSFEAGACLGIPASTACHGVFADGPVEGRWVLVTGGAGAVGHYAVQLAKWGGAHVIATVSGEEKAVHAAEAGADHIVNYRTEDVAEAVLDVTSGTGVDRLVEVEFGGNLDVTRRVMAESGTVAAYGSMAVPTPALPFYELMFRNLTLRLFLVYILPADARRTVIDTLTRALEAEALQHRIAASYPLEQAATAHETVEAGRVIGNVVVTTD